MAGLRERPAGRLRRTFARVFIFTTVALFVWGAGLFLFANSIPVTLDGGSAKTDAIVVLTGGRGRLSTGLQLLEEKRARKLFVSGVYHGVDVSMLLKLSQKSPENLKCCVEIGYAADNTAGNAAETAAWFSAQDFKSLRIVTSNYHMPRSLLEFHAVLPGKVLRPHPVFTDQFKQDRWWVWPGTARLIISEYNKFLLAWVWHAGADLLDQQAGS